MKRGDFAMIGGKGDMQVLNERARVKIVNPNNSE